MWCIGTYNGMVAGDAKRKKDSPIALILRLFPLSVGAYYGSLSLHGITSSIHSGVVSRCANSLLYLQ